MLYDTKNIFDNVIVGETLKEEIVLDKNSFFTVNKSGNQTFSGAVLTKKEIIFIKPKKPLLRPGQLLGTKSLIEISEGDLYGFTATMNCKMAKCMDDEDYRIKFIPKHGIDEFLIYEKKSDSVLIVVDERIEIYKKRIYNNFELQNDKKETHKVGYEVSHCIDVVHKSDKKTVKTLMFSESDEKYIKEIDGKIKLDLDLIKNVYRNSDIEKLIKPLELL